MNPEIRFIIRCEPGKMKKFEVDKYFRRNPPELLDTGNYRTAVVIPAFDELEELPETLRILRCAGGIEKCAVIVVVNHPAGHDSRNSLELLKKLQELDVYTIYLPELSGGAGAARKAGMDAFLASQNPEDMEKCVIFSLDADTFVESDYLHKGIPAVLKYGTVTFDFAHRRSDDERQQQAIIRYEAYLRRYVEKLRKAGSPYAFFTVGSAFAVRGDIYLRCGGMKVREAGEEYISNNNSVFNKRIFIFYRLPPRLPELCRVRTWWYIRRRAFPTGSHSVPALRSGNWFPEVRCRRYRIAHLIFYKMCWRQFRMNL